MPIIVQQALSLTYTYFLGQSLEIQSVASDTSNTIRQHTVEFSDATGKYPGTLGYVSTQVQGQTGFPVTFGAPGSSYSEIYRYGTFLTIGTFKVRSKATSSASDSGWLFSSQEATINVLPKGVFPSSVVPNPDQGSDSSTTAKFNSTKFDDGYEQRVVTGLNSQVETYSAKWAKLDLSVADALCNFFSAHRGVEWFYWTAPNAIVRKKWKVASWKRTEEVGGKVTVSANLEQVFDL